MLEISVGGIAGTVADPKLILAASILCGASAFILAHNHPSGNRQPSNVDRNLTKKLKQVGQAMELTLLDHLILIPHSHEYYSFADEGDL